MKFLIDENLSTKLVDVADGRGYTPSTHVLWRGLDSKPDNEIVRYAIENDFVMVTNNTKDFKRLIAREEIHAGLICMNFTHGIKHRAIEKGTFDLALAELDGEDLMDEVIDATLTIDRIARHGYYVWFPAP